MSEFSLVLLAVATACAVVALALWRRREAPGALGVVALLGAAAVWNAAYAGEITAGGLATKLLWAKAQYVGIELAPLSAFVFALGYTGRSAWLTRRRLAGLAVVPAVTLVLAWTHELHHLVWSGIAAPVRAGRPLALEHGPGFFPGWLFAYALLFAAAVMLVAGRSSLRRYFRRQSLAVVAGVGTPWLCNALYVLGLTPSGLDLTTIGFALTGLCFALACGRFGLLDLAPVARDAIVEHLRDGMVVVDARGRIADCNRAAAPLLACAVEDAVGRTAADVLPPGTVGLDGSRVVEVEVAGRPCAYEVEAFDLPLSAVAAGRLLLFHDVTAREQLHDLLRSQALTDELTKLGNRRSFLRHLDAALERRARTGRTLAVVFLDLDDFKAVNDTLGHDIGDRVLVATARRLEACVRPQDAVARLGGDEFTVLVGDLDGPDAAVAVAERIAAALREPIAIEGRRIPVKASVGLHLATAAEASPESVLRAADRRMYDAKAASRH